ncbi:MAG: ABC transporter ATP-binding protein [Planctomycetota bacterium]
MIRAIELNKSYEARPTQVAALSDVSVSLSKGEFLTVRGPSGAGKSTLLFSLGAMLEPDSGRVEIGGVDVYGASERERNALRRDRIGFVFQRFHLVPYLSVLENVLLGSESPSAELREKARSRLGVLGLGSRLEHLPSELSAGESQRCALARALLSEPTFVLADEPTGNLDPETSETVIDELRAYRDAGAGVLVVSHGPLAAEAADRVLTLRAGRLENGD